MRGQWHSTTDKAFRHWQNGGTGRINSEVMEYRLSDDQAPEEMYHFAPAYCVKGISHDTRIILADKPLETYQITVGTGDSAEEVTLKVYTIFNKVELLPHISDVVMQNGDDGTKIRLPHQWIGTDQDGITHKVEDGYFGSYTYTLPTIYGVKFPTIIPIVSTYCFVIEGFKNDHKANEFGEATKSIIQKYNTGPLSTRYKTKDGVLFQRPVKKLIPLWATEFGCVGWVSTSGSIFQGDEPGSGGWKNAGLCPINKGYIPLLYNCGVAMTTDGLQIYRMGYYPEGITSNLKLKLVQPLIIDKDILSVLDQTYGIMDPKFGASKGAGDGLCMYRAYENGPFINTFSVINDLKFEETEWT